MPLEEPRKPRAWPRWLGPLLGLALLFTVPPLITGGCAVNPATGKRQISLVSRSSELQMGREGDRQILAEFGAYGDSSLAEYVDRIGQELAAVSELPDLDWHFRVLDSPVVNAFALPGGYIYVSRGIIAICNSEAQLAGVIGHEIGHVTARHTAQRITQSQLAQIGLGLGTIFVPDFGRYTPMAGTSLSLLFLKYSRDHETQADELGIRYAVKAGYDPREVPSTYAVLNRLQQQQVSMLPGYLSTHPDPGDREVRTRSLSEGAAAANPGARFVGREEFVHHADSLVYGTDPRGGFLEDGVFYHPGLAFEVIFPASWDVINTANALIAADRRSESAMQLTLVPDEDAASPDEYVALLQREGVVGDAFKELGMVGGWPAWVGQVDFTDGQTGPMYVAWVQREEGYFYQYLATPPDVATREAFRQTLRTFRELTDPDKLHRAPARLQFTEVEVSRTSLEEFVASFDRLAVPVDEIALINNRNPNAAVYDGQLIKLILKPPTVPKRAETESK